MRTITWKFLPFSFLWLQTGIVAQAQSYATTVNAHPLSSENVMGQPASGLLSMQSFGAALTPIGARTNVPFGVLMRKAEGQAPIKARKSVYSTSSDNGATWMAQWVRDLDYNESGLQTLQRTTYTANSSHPDSVSEVKMTYDKRNRQVSQETFINGISNYTYRYFYDFADIPDLYTGCEFYLSSQVPGKFEKYYTDRLQFDKGVLDLDDAEAHYLRISKLNGNESDLSTYDTYVMYTDADRSAIDHIFTLNGKDYDCMYVPKKWHKTNGKVIDAGQVFFWDLNFDVDSDNQLEEGTVKVLTAEGNVDREIQITATYDENGGFTRTAITPQAKNVLTRKWNENGDEIFTMDEYTDPQGDGAFATLLQSRESGFRTLSDGQRVQLYLNQIDYNDDGTENFRGGFRYDYDEHENEVHRESKMSTDGGATWYYTAFWPCSWKYEYDPETGNPLSREYWKWSGENDDYVCVSRIEYEYDSESSEPCLTKGFLWSDEAQAFVLSEKIEYSDFRSCTTGISVSVTDAPQAQTAVYNVQGRYVGTTTDGLPAGVYVLKQGAHSVKVLKR